MTENKKPLNEIRRTKIIDLLKQSQEPIKAAYLAQITGVSRQVIVQDIALLKAKKEPILATPQGYVYMIATDKEKTKKVIFCIHSPQETEKELNILVDHGLEVLDVGVDHPIYGKIYRQLNLKSRVDVKKFIEQMKDTGSNLLASLTNGLHFHTVEIPSEESFSEVCKVLKEEGLLFETETTL